MKIKSFLDCSYFAWSTWSSCNVSCGQGSQTRSRSCLYLNSNTQCNTCGGNSSQTQICQQSPCEGLNKCSNRKRHLILIL
jgi:hypothetical protein